MTNYVRWLVSIMTNGFRVDPITPTIGAQIEGVNLSLDLDAVTFAEIKRLLLKHRVIFFENQHITPQQQRDFAARFGEFEIHPTYKAHPDCPEIAVLATGPENPPDTNKWHTDMTFRPTPPKITILYSRVIPSGGDTLWSNMRAAYEGLPDSMKKKLDTLDAVHDFLKFFPADNPSVLAIGKNAYDDVKRRNPPVIHPVIRTHPETGEDCLFVSEGFTTKIIGLPEEESDSILHFLADHIQKPEFCMRWRWVPDTLAMWDNRSTQHYAVNDYLPQKRLMHRATIVGDRPKKGI